MVGTDIIVISIIINRLSRDSKVYWRMVCWKRSIWPSKNMSTRNFYCAHNVQEMTYSNIFLYILSLYFCHWITRRMKQENPFHFTMHLSIQCRRFMQILGGFSDFWSVMSYFNWISLNGRLSWPNISIENSDWIN